MADTKRTSDSHVQGGMGNEAPHLRNHSSASIAELQEFLQRFDGKSPQEVLGIVSDSGLMRATIVATIAFLVLLVVLTVVPYAIQSGGTETVSGEPAPQETPAAEDAGQTPDTGAAEPSDSAATRSSTPSTGSPDLDRAVNSMGIGETRQAAPSENPLDDNLDSLLDGVK